MSVSVCTVGQRDVSIFHVACNIEKYPIDVPAVDTHRPKPKVRVFDVSINYCNSTIAFRSLI